MPPPASNSKPLISTVIDSAFNAILVEAILCGATSSQAVMNTDLIAANDIGLGLYTLLFGYALRGIAPPVSMNPTHNLHMRKTPAKEK